MPKIRKIRMIIIRNKKNRSMINKRIVVLPVKKSKIMKIKKYGMKLAGIYNNNSWKRINKKKNH